MAARTRRGTTENGWDENTRSKIQASMLINRLENHVLGEVEMTTTQVRAAEILLRKRLPDLQATYAADSQSSSFGDFMEEISGKTRGLPRDS